MGHPRATPSASRDRPLPRLDRAPARRLGHRRGERAMIRFVGLRKEYGPTVAVAGLDFTIEQGRVFGFIGPNGAGKTTTIRMMMGLLAPTAGSVLLGGHDIGREPEAAKAITGYVPDHPFLHDKLTGGELGSLAELRTRAAAQVDPAGGDGSLESVFLAITSPASAPADGS